MSTENLLNLKIHKLTQESYDNLAEKDSTALYLTPDITDKDVILSEPFTLTKDFGYYMLNGAASIKAGAARQSLHEFLQGAFANEDKTTFSIPPSFSINMSGATGEVGSTASLSASLNQNINSNTNKCSYKWGTFNPATQQADYTNKLPGITYDSTAIEIKDGDKTVTSFVFKDGATTLIASCTVTRTAVMNHPCSNLGNDIYAELDSKYKAEDVLLLSRQATFTGYRAFFYGAITVAPTAANLTSSVIRSLRNGGNYSTSSKNIEIKANGQNNLKAFVIALPQDSSGNAIGGISKVMSTDGLATEVTGQYYKASFTVSVADYSGASTWGYNIYIFSPSTIDNRTVHQITLA